MEFRFPDAPALALAALNLPEAWSPWIGTPANLLAILAPLCGLVSAAIWAVRIHRQALRTAGELRVKVAELASEKEAGDAANLAKDEFLVKLSHEIRTPMNGIIGFAELASKTELTLDQRRYLDTVLYSAEWLNQVVADVLDFTRMQSAEVKLERRPFSVCDMVISAVKILEPKALEKHLSLTYNIDERVPPTCLGDGSRLRQVLVNLLENAVKFTSTGSVMLAVRVEEGSGTDCLLSFMVADTGIGIPPERQESIFEPFQAGGKQDPRRVSGAGLGLSICRHLTSLMGGTIEVQSQIGAGSTFRFTARFQKTEVSPAPSSESPIRHSARRLSILLAEADANSRRMNTKLLESAGHQVTPASRAQEAVDKFSTDLFDLVLLDAEMSDIDPVRPCDQLRDCEADSARTPIYMFLPGDRPPGVEIDGYLRKPIDVEELMAVVNRVAFPQAANLSDRLLAR